MEPGGLAGQTSELTAAEAYQIRANDAGVSVVSEAKEPDKIAGSGPVRVSLKVVSYLKLYG